MNPFTKDLTVTWKGADYRVLRTVEPDSVQLEHSLSGAVCTKELGELLTDFMSQELLLPSQKAQAARSPRALRPVAQATVELRRAEERRRLDYLSSLNQRGAFEQDRSFVQAELHRIAAARGDVAPPHISTIYRWRTKFLEAQEDIRALMSLTHQRGGAGRSRLHPEIEEIIDLKIDSVFLARKDCSAEELHNAVFLEVQHRNTTRVESEWLKVPGLRTIQRRIRGLGGYDVARARYGEREADRAYANLGVSRCPRHILDIVEIDHTPVDALVVDEHRRVVGRPTITVVLDRKSRVVLGFHLSLAGYGTEAVFAAIQCAIFPKTHLQNRYKELGLRWDCFGWPNTLLMDNGSEFHGDAVEDALRNIGITTEFSKSKDPNCKPFVERFHRTLNYSFIRRLPGATQSHVHKRRGTKPEDEACLTLAELDRAIHIWICSVYHQRPHAGLRGATPMQVWAEGAKSIAPVLRCSPQEVDIEFSHIERRTVQHYGIDHNTFRYTSTRLMSLRAMNPTKWEVDVKWPFRDAGHIWVYDDYAQEYFKVPNVETQYAGLTVEQAKVASKVIADSPELKATRAAASAVVDDIVASGVADKKLKARRKAQRFDNQTSRKSRERTAAAEVAKDRPPFAMATLCAEDGELIVEVRA